VEKYQLKIIKKWRAILKNNKNITSFQIIWMLASQSTNEVKRCLREKKVQNIFILIKFEAFPRIQREFFSRMLFLTAYKQNSLSWNRAVVSFTRFVKHQK
jgi:hypothetical protein